MSLLKTLLLSRPAFAAYDALHNMAEVKAKAAADEAAKKRKRQPPGTAFMHYVRARPAIKLYKRARSRRITSFLHATKGWRTFSRGVPAPLGFTARPPGKMARLHAALAQGTAR